MVPPSDPGCGSRGGGRPELLGETQQSRRPGHHPVLGAGPGLPGLDRWAGGGVPPDSDLCRLSLLLSAAPPLSWHHVTWNSGSQDFSAPKLRVKESYFEEAENGHKAALVTLFEHFI